jgi:hypothetical protein
VLLLPDRNYVNIMKFEVNEVVTVKNDFLACGLVLSGTHFGMFPKNFLHHISGHGSLLLIYPM